MSVLSAVDSLRWSRWFSKGFIIELNNFVDFCRFGKRTTHTVPFSLEGQAADIWVLLDGSSILSGILLAAVFIVLDLTFLLFGGILSG